MMKNSKKLAALALSLAMTGSLAACGGNANTPGSADDNQSAGIMYAVEAGSAGEAIAKENGYTYNAVSSQADALMEVASGTSEAAIIDLLMAGAMIGEGTSYTDLTYTVKLNSEEYGVGFRKGSDLAAALNDFFAASYKDGSLKKTAETYGVQESLIAQ